MLTLNALTAADRILGSPFNVVLCLEGLGQLINTVKLVQNNLSPDLAIERCSPDHVMPRTNLSQQVIDEVVNYFMTKVYKTIIPKNVRLSEAPSFGQPITIYYSNSKVLRPTGSWQEVIK